MHEDSFSGELDALAAAFHYPPTPDLATRERDRLRRRAPLVHAQPRSTLRRSLAIAMILILLLAALLAIPPVRAALLRVLQIGAFEINLVEEPANQPPSTPLPASLTDLGTVVSMQEAEARFPFPLFAPPALGEPNWVYAQDFSEIAQAITLVWNDGYGATGSQIMLTYIGHEGVARKIAAGEQVTDVAVDGVQGVWIEGPHLFNLQGLAGSSVAVEGNVLIWSDGMVTYRLEGMLTLDEAVELAKSLR